MSMKAMRDLRDMLCDELDKIAAKRDMNPGDLETVHKLTDTIKNIDKIEMLEEDDGYSRDGDWEADMRGTYGRGSSYRGRKRDSMGRYSRTGRMYPDRVYSRGDAKEHMMEQMEDMMGGANEREKEILRRAMDQLEKV